MSERKYVVVVKDGIDIADLDKELSSRGGSSTVPTRKVKTLNARPKNNKMTDYWLTEEEAAALYEDERVEKVIPKVSGEVVDNVDDKFDKGHFWAVDSHTNTVPQLEIGFPNQDPIHAHGDLRNHGLYIHSGHDKFENLDPQNQNNIKLKHPTITFDDGTVYNTTAFTDGNIYGKNTHYYKYDGEGVDWVSIDSGILADHPDFDDELGNSRVQRINWYEETGIVGNQHEDHYKVDPTGHGTHVASIACGKKHGWAKKANIYVCSYSQIADGEGKTEAERVADAFDLVLAWHNQKTSGRPTVLNLSIGLRYFERYGNTAGEYRGQAWTGVFNNFTDLAIGQPLIHNTTGQQLVSGDDINDSTFKDEVSATNEKVRQQMWNYGVHYNASLVVGSSNVGGVLHSSSVDLNRTMSNFIVDAQGNVNGEEINTLLGQCISAGIHCVTAAGNESQWHDVESPDHVYDEKYDLMGSQHSAGRDWNNKETIFVSPTETDNGGNKLWCRTETTDNLDNPNGNDENGNQITNLKREYWYHRPPAPYHHQALNVGSVGTKHYFGQYTKLHKSRFSNCGAAVNIWACGQNVVAASGRAKDEDDFQTNFSYHTAYEKDLVNNPKAAGYKKTSQSGTSMACPQVSGIACLYLQQNPNLTPVELQQLVIKEAENERYYDGGTDPWTSVNTSWSITKTSPWDVYGHVNGQAFQTDEVAGSDKVVKAPSSGTGSMTIENHLASTNDNTKKLTLTSDCYLKYSKLTHSINGADLDMTLTMYDNAEYNIAAITGIKDLISIRKREFSGSTLVSDDILNVTLTDNEDGTYTFTTPYVGYNSPTHVCEYIGQINGEPFENVLIVGEHAQITSSNTATALIDGSAAGQTVYTATSNQSGTVWHLETGLLDAASFTMNVSTGVVTINSSPDYGTNQSYSFIVRATHTNGFRTYKTVTIPVVDSTAPTITYTKTLASSTSTLGSSSVTIGVYENTSPTVLGEIVATDPSTPITLSVVGNVPSVFAFDTANGEVSLTGAIDYETTQAYNFVVRATDSLGNFGDYTVNINVLDVDEIPPVITSGTTGATLEEHITYTGGDVHYTAVADETVTWQLNETDNSASSYLQINSSSGAVTSLAPIDHNIVGDTYTVKITATDTAGNTSSINVGFPITEQYEGAVHLESSNYTLSPLGIIVENINEMDFANIVLDTVQAKCTQSIDGYTAGDDLPQSQFVNYHIVSQNIAGFFTINQSNGQLKATVPLDYETYSGNINVTVGCHFLREGVQQTASLSYVFSLINTDDEAPVWTVSNSHITQNSPLAAGSTLIDVSSLVSDPDGAMSTPFTYSISSSAPIYGINSSTGVVTNLYAINSAGSATPFTVTATDQAGNSSNYTFTISYQSSAITTTTYKSSFTIYGNYYHGHGYGYSPFGSSVPSTINGATIRGNHVHNVGSSYQWAVEFDGHHPKINSIFRYVDVNVGGNTYTFDTHNALAHGNTGSSSAPWSYWRWTIPSNGALWQAISNMSGGSTYTVDWRN